MKLLVSIAKKLLYLAAFFIIVAAFFVSVSIVITPIFTKHLTDIEKWTSRLLELPVTISHAKLSWYRYQPVIRLDHVTLQTKDTHKPVLQLQKVILFFSIPQTLLRWQPVPSGILISGTRLNIREYEKEKFNLQGINIGGKSSPTQEAALPAMLGWIIVQPRIILEDIAIHFSNRKGEKRFVTLNRLSLTNNANTHLIVGKAILHQQLSTDVTVVIRWLGSELDLKKIRAKIYLYASGVSLSQWLKNNTWQQWQLLNGALSAKIWANWHLGQFRKVQSIFQIYRLSLRNQLEKQNHYIDRLSGHVGWRVDAKTGQQIIAGDDILIDFADHLWPVTNFNLVLNKDWNGHRLYPSSFKVNFLKLEDIQHLFFSSLSSTLPKETTDLIQQLNISGNLQHFAITLPSTMQWLDTKLFTKFDHLQLQAYKDYPGLANFSGDMAWDNRSGKINILSKNVEINYPFLFNHSIFLQEINSQLLIQPNAFRYTPIQEKEIEYLKKMDIFSQVIGANKLLPSLTKQTVQNDTNKWLVSINNLNIINEGLNAVTHGNIEFSKNFSTINLDLICALTMREIRNLPYYFPVKILAPGLTTWLNKAFLAGSIDKSQIRFKGNINDFPFTKNNGEFLAEVNVSNTDLHYADDWPALKNINGVVKFHGAKLTIDTEEAKILNIPLQTIHAEISDLSSPEPSVLRVSSNQIAADFIEATQLINSSPLQKKLGSIVSILNLTGPVNLNINLIIPLSNPYLTTVIGLLTFNNAMMQMSKWGLTIDHLAGALNFTEKSISSGQITGQLLNRPLKFKLSTISQPNNQSIIKAQAQTELGITDLTKWLKLPLTDYATGSTLVNLDIDLSFEQPIKINLKSDLQGIAIHYNKFVDKTALERKAFHTEIIVNEREPLKVKVYYDHIQAAILLKYLNSTLNLSGLTLGFNTPNISWPVSDGLSLVGQFNIIDWANIKDNLSVLQTSGEKSILPLKDVDISVHQLNIAGQQIDGLNVQAEENKEHWAIKIKSNQIMGELNVPQHFNANEILSGQLNHLNIRTSKNKKPAANIDFALDQLPAFSINIKQFSLNERVLGALLIKTSVDGKSQTIDTLQLHSATNHLSAKGKWSQKNNINISRIHGKLKSTQVNDLLNRLGFDVHNITFSQGELDFNLAWDGVPYAINLESLDGEITLNLGPGRIVEVDQASEAKLDIGRMLSVFSLQSLPRRLTLNFKDVFEKGYAFNKLAGEFNIRHGNMFTSNFYIDGPVARLGINGRIGLVNKDYDLILSVTPYVTSTLPVAAMLLTGQPLIGLAAFAINSVIDATHAATYHYAIKGPWSQPTWQSVRSR